MCAYFAVCLCTSENQSYCLSYAYSPVKCKTFVKHLAEKLAEKDVEGYPFVIISWLRTRVSFKIFKAVNRQSFFRSEVVDDFKVNNFLLANPFCDCNFVFKLTEYEISVKKRDV